MKLPSYTRILSYTVMALAAISAIDADSQAIFNPVDQIFRASIPGIDRLDNIESALSIDLVTIADEHLRTNQIVVNLPGVDTLIFHKTAHNKTAWPGSWSGKLDNSPGAASFTVRDGKVSGLISGEFGTYEIVYSGTADIHAIIKHDPTMFEACDTPSAPSHAGSESDDSGRRPLRSSDPEECVVRLLIAYTPGAQQNTMDIYNRTMIDHIGLAIELMNASFVNSLSDQRVELAHLYKTTDTESGIITIDINDFRNTDDGKWDEVHELRDRYNADMVALITDGSYTGSCGRAYGFNYTSAEDMFQISEYDCIIPNFTMAHEFGHLQGARHDIDQTTTPYSYGHGYSQGSTYRTIMAVCCDAPRINHWSNPNVSYPGTGPMGSTEFSNNALVTNESFGMIAGHRTTPMELDTDHILLDDHIATNSSEGQLNSFDSISAGGCLILQSSSRIVLRPGFMTSDGSLGTYRIVPGCNEQALIQSPVSTQQEVKTNSRMSTVSSDQKK